MKLLTLCMCEKVIIDKQGAHSLINLMLQAEIQAANAEEIPSNAVSPSQWFIYSMWVPSTSDVGLNFEQVYQIYWPDGEKFSEHRFEFLQADGNVQQVTFGLFGFPIGQAGRLRIVTWLDHAGHRVSDIVETSINVKHSVQPTANPVTA